MADGQRSSRGLLPPLPAAPPIALAPPDPAGKLSGLREPQATSANASASRAHWAPCFATRFIAVSIDQQRESDKDTWSQGTPRNPRAARSFVALNAQHGRAPVRELQIRAAQAQQHFGAHGVGLHHCRAPVRELQIRAAQTQQHFGAHGVGLHHCRAPVRELQIRAAQTQQHFGAHGVGLHHCRAPVRKPQIRAAQTQRTCKRRTHRQFIHAIVGGCGHPGVVC